MPPRIARASVSAAAPKTARNKNKKRSLDAYAAAAKALPAPRLSRNRAGVVEEESRPKRRRAHDGDDGSDEDDLDEKPRRKRPANGPADADVEYGSDSSGNEWTLGGLAEDDDDSEIDSDDAFGESDEERFSGFTFRGSTKPKDKLKTKKSQQQSGRGRQDGDINLDEEESEGEFDDGDSEDDVGAGFGDDGVDLATMLDDDDDEMLGGMDSTSKDMGELSASDDEMSDDESENSDSLLDDEEDDDDDDDAADEERVARMKDRIEAMNPSVRDISGTSSRQGDAATLDDFLEDTNLEAAFLPHQKSKKKLVAPSAVAAPLPKRQQDRIDRKVATEKAKEELDRWKDTVVQNRRAEFLSFPLQTPSDQKATLGKDKFITALPQAPRNELEENIQRIMEESGLAAKEMSGGADTAGDEEAALLKSEELGTNKLPVEEVMRRRAELRRARELLFREEVRAKRIAKIKSKSYRRVHRKEKERMAEQERQALEEMGVDPDEDEKEKSDRLRAEARMSTKHKESKWAKSLKATSRAAWDDDARDGVYEQARRNEELKRRIAGKDISDAEDDDSASEDDSDDDGDDAAAIVQLTRSQDQSSEPKGLAALKFMRNADERRRKENDEQVQAIRKELAIQDGDESENDEEAESLGRAIFGPQSREPKAIKPKERRLEFEAPAASDDEDEAQNRAEDTPDEGSQAGNKKPIVNLGDAQTRASRPLSTRAQPVNDPEGAKSASSWLQQGAKSASSSWLQAAKGTKQTGKKVIPNDKVTVQIDQNTAQRPAKMQATLSSGHWDGNEQQAPSVSAPDTQGWQTVTLPETNNDDEDEEELVDPIERNITLKQRAFAGDDVQSAFEAEKAELADSEDEKEVSNYLPGWGAWAGEGLTKKEKKINARAKHNPLFKTKTGGVKQADRKDAKLKNVIISEKNDRKGRKYLAAQLPHEFESREQYERSRRLPMGPEWTTKEVHQRQTRPRVVVKPGVLINALEKPLV